VTATDTSAVDVGTTERFPGMDGLRAIAAGGVVLVHVALISGYAFRQRHGIGPYLARAELGVALFFLISGFLLYRPFVAAAYDDRPGPALPVYFRRRLLRIVPAYWLALTVLVVLLDVRERGDIGSLREVVIYYGFLQTYFDDTALGGIQQAWSLCTEMAFYVTLPVWAWLLRRAGGRRGANRRLGVELAALAALYLFGFVYRWVCVRDAGPAIASLEYRVNWLPANADLFALGMAVAVLQVHAARWPASVAGRVAATAGRIGGWWWLGAAASYWLVAEHAGLSVGVGADTPGQWMRREVLYGSTALFLLLPAVFGDQARGAVRRLLRSGPLATVGLVSYGVYLWHEGVLDAYRSDRGYQPFSGPFAPELAITVVATGLVAAASWFVVEKPALRRK
jgi:peptidoglycan/LPS O-acetylase OafA/YrhL